MGQQQSAEEKKDKDKVKRRQSTFPPSTLRSRATPVKASATTESATAHTSSPQHLEKPQLQHILQSSSPESMSRHKIGHSSKREKEKHEEAARYTKEPVNINVPSPSVPMNVPTPPSSKSKADDLNEKSYERHNFGDGQNDFEEPRYVPPAEHRPPRLPLPIADVDSVPDSPTLRPIDNPNSSEPDFFGTDDVLAGDESKLRRKSSMMSATTQDDDDIGDELPPIDTAAETVPTVIEWLHPGHRVYVTGTFVNWEKKYRLHRKHDSGLATTINLPPGTHHLMFLVDEKMITNPSMPTAVDFNNVLLNYIEVAHLDTKSRRDSRQPSDDKPQALPIHPPQVLPDDSSDRAFYNEDAEPVAEEILPGDFRQIIPQPLVDMDFPEEDPRWKRAYDIICECQVPPQLPMFLGKSLLNGYTPVKDDSSVLILPNHTVLNHLMTSSVKSGVLATSVTTRYKKKYVTTISFKPIPKGPNATPA